MFKVKRVAGMPRRGAVAAVVGVTLPLVVAVTAVALDGGTLYSGYQMAQGSADAAALAAAYSLYNNYSTNVSVHAPIETPYGAAIQDTSSAAISARVEVEAGANLYRTGTLGRSQGVEAQFWSLEPPTAPGFAGRYGIPPENVANANFTEVGKLRPGTPFVTRRAPGVGTNPGGGIEVVVPEGGVEVGVFSSAR